MIRKITILWILAANLLIAQISKKEFYDSLKIYRETFYPNLTRTDSINSLNELTNEIDRILNNRYVRSSKVGAAVFSIDQNRYYYKKNLDLPLTPASVTKLFTTFTALYQLGSEYKISTEIYTDGEIIDSVLHGNLYMIGRGDPVLSVADIEILSDDICRLGIKHVFGDIIADGSFFDDRYDRFDYSEDDDEVAPVAYISGLSIERNYATVLVKAGNRRGMAVDLQVIPPSDYFQLDNKAKVAYVESSYKESQIAEDNIANRFGDMALSNNFNNDSRIRIYVNNATEETCQKFNIRGRISRNRTYSRRYKILNPELAAVGTFKNRLESGGTIVYGSIKNQKILNTDKYYELRFLTEYKRELKPIIEETNKSSDNYLAESLFKLVGAEAGHQIETAEGSRDYKRRIMTDLEIPFDNCKINDGSGLSRRNLVTPEAVIELLLRARNLNFSHVFENSLSVAGKDGTLEGRMVNTNANHNLRAKTGTLRNVSALAGYVETLDGELLAFAFLFNGYAVSTYKSVENELGKALSDFFYHN